MVLFPISWIIRDRIVFEKFCQSSHRRKHLLQALRNKKGSYKRLVDLSWVSDNQDLFEEFLRSVHRLRIRVQRRIKGLKEKANEPIILVISKSNYQHRKTLVWCKKRLKLIDK